jgi:cytidine deaminase
MNAPAARGKSVLPIATKPRSLSAMPNDEHPSGLAAGQIDMLRKRATVAAASAHAPYSRFRVGAAVLLESGEIFTGCNVENASFGLTNCAERSAVFTAVSQLGGGIRIRAVAIVNLNQAASAPCGACRQVLLEFSGPDTWIFFPGPKGDADARFSDILPFAFHLPTE